jgi:hypothetical protein
MSLVGRTQPPSSRLRASPLEKAAVEIIHTRISIAVIQIQNVIGSPKRASSGNPKE